jgi:hypothetical protein
MTAAKPVRLRLSRARGFSLQSHSLATNGLLAVSVARPSKWGNPWRVQDWGRAKAVALFRCGFGERADLKASIEKELRGKNLGCYCPLEAECHADVLLDVANRGDA